MTNKQILTAMMMLALGCSSEVVESGEIQITVTDTEAGYGGTGGTGETAEPDPHECWADDAPAGAVRWQCEGVAQAAIHATLNVQIPDAVPDAEILQEYIDYGLWYWQDFFGPLLNGETYDDPGVDACCLPDLAGDEAEGVDETGADAPGGDVPQVAMACAHDCADQACRQIPDTLRDMAAEIPAGIPLIGPSYRSQLEALANWVAAHQQECWNAMVSDGVSELGAGYVVNGTWQIPNSEAWPDVTELSVDGNCKIYSWYLPEQGEPHACTGINDNNDEGPFGSGGSLGGFDTFAPTGGELRLEGPTILGIPASGSAPLLGLGDACPRGECSRLDAWVGPEALELRRLVLTAPATMSWEREGMRLGVDGLHAMVEHPLTVPLLADGDVMRFELPVGTLELLVAGRVHGVPVKVVVPNATPVTGTVLPLFDGSHGIVIDPFTVEHHDSYGTWAMHVELGELVAVEHAPRVTLEVQGDGSGRTVDASASFDPDGDPLDYAWYRDGMQVAEGPVVESSASGSALTLVVTDPTGRSTSSHERPAEAE